MHAAPVDTLIPSRVQRRRDELPRRAREADVERPGQPLRAVAVAARARDREQPRLQPIAQRRRRAPPPSASSAARQARRDAEADDAAHVLGPGAALALLVPARGERRERHARDGGTTAPTPFGPWSLCADSVSASTPSASTSTSSLPAACTASVWNSAPAVVRHARERRDVVDVAELVVGERQRHQHRVGAQRRAQRVGRDAAVGDRRRRT